MHASVEIHTAVNLRVPYDRLKRSGFPPLFTLTDEAPAAIAGRLVHHAGPGGVEIDVEDMGATITVRCSIDRLGDGEPLLELAGVQLERQLQLGGVVSLDAACVSLQAGAALLLGPPGAGKTSVAVGLCTDWRGELVGNDLCLLALSDGGVTAQAGSRALCFRLDAVRRNLPVLSAQLGDRIRPGWFSKTPVQPEELGIPIAEGPTPITGAYVLHVDDRATSVAADRDPPHAQRLLYEGTSRRIRGSCTPFLAGDDLADSAYLPALDCERCWSQRARLIDALVRDVGIAAVSGSAREVTRWISVDVRCRRARD